MICYCDFDLVSHSNICTCLTFTCNYFLYQIWHVQFEHAIYHVIIVQSSRVLLFWPSAFDTIKPAGWTRITYHVIQSKRQFLIVALNFQYCLQNPSMYTFIIHPITEHKVSQLKNLLSDCDLDYMTLKSTSVFLWLIYWIGRP